MKSARLALCLVPLLLAGCGGSSPEDVVLATVAGDPITAADFEATWRRIEPASRPDISTPEARESFLRDMINKSLLEKEADEVVPELPLRMQWRLERMRRNELRDMVNDRLVGDQVEVTEADKDALYARIQKDVRVDGIVVETEDMAGTLLERIRDGASFEDVALDYSMLEGEDPGRPWDVGWVAAGRFDPPAEARIWGLDDGEVDGPIFDKNLWWIIRKVEERPIPAPDTRGVMDEQLDLNLREYRYLKRQKAVLDSIRAAADRQFPTRGLELLMFKFKWEPPEGMEDDPMAYLNDPRVLPSLTAEEESTVVITFADQPDWTMGEFSERLEWYPAGVWPRGNTVEQTKEAVDLVIRDHLLEKAARDLGFDNTEEYREAVEQRRRQMQVNSLYRDHIMASLEMTEEDTRAWFEENRDRYKAAPSYRIASFGSADAEAMGELAEDWGGGMSFGDVRDKYEVRVEDLEYVGDSNWIHEGQDPGLDDHLAPFKEGAVADVFVRSDRAYAIKVLARRGERLVTYEEAKDVVDRDVETGMRERVLVEYLDGLEEKFPVTVHEEAVADLEIEAEDGE